MNTTETAYPFACFDDTGIRRSGKTTRLVDAAIQELFSGKEVTIIDHHFSPDAPASSNIKASEHLLHQILRRLDIEHRINFESNYIKLIKRRNGFYTILQLK